MVVVVEWWVVVVLVGDGGGGGGGGGLTKTKERGADGMGVVRRSRQTYSQGFPCIQTDSIYRAETGQTGVLSSLSIPHLGPERNGTE